MLFEGLLASLPLVVAIVGAVLRRNPSPYEVLAAVFRSLAAVFIVLSLIKFFWPNEGDSVEPVSLLVCGCLLVSLANAIAWPMSKTPL